VRWLISVIPAIREMEMGRLRSEASLGKSARPYLKNKLKSKKGWGCGSSGRVLAQQVQGKSHY
jgi:hypothetical protein